MKIRIAVQKVKDGKYKHIHNIMLITKDSKTLIRKLRSNLKKEIGVAESQFLIWLSSRQKSFVKKIIDETEEDKTDWKAKGADISKEEFLENEIFWETR